MTNILMMAMSINGTLDTGGIAEHPGTVGEQQNTNETPRNTNGTPT